MNMAQRARRSAIPFEAKKDGLRQRQSGDWVLSLVIAAADMDQRITAAAMGTRYACVLVEKNDDESPREHAVETRDKWRSLGPTTQAGIRCADPVFWAWLEEEGYPRGNRVVCNSHDDAAELVRAHCGVASRADLNKPGFGQHRLKWYEMDNAFQGWKAKENA